MFFRQKYLVSGRQLFFCLKILALTLIPSLMITMSVLFVFGRLHRVEYIDFLSRNPVLVVEYIRRTITHILVSFVGLNAVVIFTTLLVYSNRVFGPIHNLKLKIAKLQKGEKVPELRLRKNDEFADLADLVNKADIYKK